MGMKIPDHCIFAPSEHELIRECLNRKLRGEELMYDDAMFEMERHDIYGGGKEPWDIYRICNPQDKNCAIHLFTTPHKINLNYIFKIFSYNSTVASGVWKVQNNGSSVPIKDPDNGNQVIGFKKSFIYERKNDNNNASFYMRNGIEWRMTEYTTLHPPMVQSLDRVVCKIELSQNFLDDGVVYDSMEEGDWAVGNWVEAEDEED